MSTRQDTSSGAKTSKRGEREVTPPPAGSIADVYRSVLPALEFEAEQTKWDVALTVPASQVHTVIATSLRDERLSMNLLRNLTAVDWEDEGIEVVYHLYSTEHRHSVAIKTMLPARGASLRSVTDVHLGADWAEREVREMFGVEFEGHPDPRNLLLDEDLDIHPLLKSHPLVPIEIKQGVDVEYFRKEHPEAPPEEAGGDDERTQRIAEAKKRATAAAGGKAEAKPTADLTPEELAEKKAAQAERVKRGRELAAAARAGKPLPTDDAGSAAVPAATAPAPAAKPAAPVAKAAAPAEKKSRADMTPEELEAHKAAQAERVKRGRELAAARRAELRGEGG